MRIRNFSNSVFVSAIIAVLVLASCQKEIDIDLENPPPVPGEIQDSTLLIKSIQIILEDKDSVTEYYSYDSVNRKIILTWDNASNDMEIIDGASAELNYNSKGLLSHIDYKYPNGYVPADEERSSTEFTYDPDKVLQKITFTFYNGKSETTIFNKTVLSAGEYELSWKEPSPVPSSNDSAKVQTIFDANGRLLISRYTYSYAMFNGIDSSYTQIIGTDSLIYDANGSVSKVITNRIDTLRHTNETIIWAEFMSRQSKGDQLYNQHQTLLNGIADIPYGDEWNGDFAGIFSIFLGGLEPLGYSKFPFQTAKVYNGRTYEFDNFSASSEIDSKDRLIKFRGFWYDGDLISCDWKISYYK